MSPFWFQSIERKNAIIGLLLFFLVIGYLCILPPKNYGDGNEYILMQEAFWNHGGFVIQKSDVLNLAQSGRGSGQIRTEWLEDYLLPGMRETRIVNGFVYCPDGEYRSYHFWAYSLFSLPFRLLSNLFGLDFLYSFTFLHAALLWAVVYFVICGTSFGCLEKTMLALSILLQSLVFYFDWIHPELFSSLLFFAAFVCLVEKRIAFSLLLASLAAFQNQPIALALPVIYVAGAWLGWKKEYSIWKSILPFRNKLDWILAGVAGIIVILPSVYYHIVYGYSNPIAALGGVTLSGISWSRFISLWFDFTQGVIVGFPGVLIALFVSLFALVFTPKKECTQKDAILALFILLALFLCSIPCLMQGNWNAGCASMLRYGSWLGAPLIIILVLSVRNAPVPMKSVVWGIFLVGQMTVPIYAGIPAGTNYLKFNAFSRWVLFHHPSFYHPEPEIFAERLMGEEEMLWNRAYVFERNDKIRKILFNLPISENSISWGKDIAYVPQGRYTTAHKSDNWVYFNGDFEVVETKSLTIGYDDQDVDWIGWSVAEPGFRWSLGTQSEVRFNFQKHVTDQDVLLKLYIYPQKSKDLKMTLNGRLLFEGQIYGPTHLRVKAKLKWFSDDGKNSIVFDVVNPGEALSKRDERVLGIQFRELIFQYFES